MPALQLKAKKVEKEEELEVILEGATVWVELADSLLKEVPELKPQEARRC
jgi:hypothetical protein